MPRSDSPPHWGSPTCTLGLPEKHACPATGNCADHGYMAPADFNLSPHFVGCDPECPRRSFSCPPPSCSTPAVPGAATAQQGTSWTPDLDAVAPHPTTLHKRSQSVGGGGGRAHTPTTSARVPLEEVCRPLVSLGIPARGAFQQDMESCESRQGGPLGTGSDAGSGHPPLACRAPSPVWLPAATAGSWDVDVPLYAQPAAQAPPQIVAARFRSTSPVSAVFQRSMSASSHQQLQLSLQGVPPAGMTAGRGGAGSRVYSGGGTPAANPWVLEHSNAGHCDVVNPVRIHSRVRQGRLRRMSTPLLGSAPHDWGPGIALQHGADAPGGDHAHPLHWRCSQRAGLQRSSQQLLRQDWSPKHPPLHPLCPRAES